MPGTGNRIAADCVQPPVMPGRRLPIAAFGALCAIGLRIAGTSAGVWLAVIWAADRFGSWAGWLFVEPAVDPPASVEAPAVLLHGGWPALAVIALGVAVILVLDRVVRVRTDRSRARALRLVP